MNNPFFCQHPPELSPDDWARFHRRNRRASIRRAVRAIRIARSVPEIERSRYDTDSIIWAAAIIRREFPSRNR